MSNALDTVWPNGTNPQQIRRALAAIATALKEDIQPKDADLAALAALATTGILARTAAATFATRTITGTAGKITVTYGDGVSGNPTIDLYVAPTVSLSGGSSNEKGVTVTSVALTWTVNKTIVSQTLTDHSPAPDPADRAHTFSGLTLTTNKTYTVAVTDDLPATVSSSTTVAFYDKRHWGVSTNTTLTSAQILTLASNTLASSRNMSATFDCTGGRYIFFAWPTTWGTPTFTVNGLVDSSWVSNVVNPHTNASGYDSSFTTWRSLNLLNGSSVSVVVT
jgi:hypothetical protein